ncbi:MAG: LysE family translocator [Spirochaetes bacterium]|nr:LysE family translocator [Spirochaetota bacterium]
MFGIAGYWTFLFSGILLNITPGADTMYILGRSIAQGKKAGVVSVLGISTGSLVHTCLAALGLSAVLRSSPLAFNLVKYAGAAYLGYLGARMLISKSTDPIAAATADTSKAKKLAKIYRQGFITNLLNPKVALFFLSFLPQFVSPDNQYGALPFFILGLSFVCTGTFWCLGIALFASKASAALRQNGKISLILNKATCIVFIALALNLLRARAGP